jgi:hypothetical protein
MCSYVGAQANVTRTLSGVIVTQQDELLPGVTISLSYQSGEQKTVSDAEGRFQFTIPNETLTARIEGKNIKPFEKRIYQSDPTENLKIKVELIVPTIHESVVITANALDPTVDRRNDTIYKNTLFGRDDQLLQTLNAGINVGQHGDDWSPAATRMMSKFKSGWELFALEPLGTLTDFPYCEYVKIRLPGFITEDFFL